MKRKMILQVCVIALLSLIPALYAFIFLSAYWDPASHLSEVSVAVVNNDRGAVVDGETMNIGNSLVENLKENHDIHWVFTTVPNAEEGVATGSYYAMFLIPDDFSECISTAVQPEKTKGTLYIKSNDKMGTFASSAVSNLSAGIESLVSKSITESLVETLTVKLGELPDSLQSLSNGLAQLDEGTGQLYEGLTELAKGQSEFNGGVEQLAAGLANAGNGGKNLTGGLKQLGAKATLFANTLNQNLGKLNTLTGSTGKYGTGLKALSTNLNTYLDAATASMQRSMSIIAWLQAYIASHPESAADPHMQQILAALQAMGGGSSDPAAAAASLKEAMAKLTAAYTQLNGGVQTLPEGMRTAAGSAKALSDAIGQLLGGSQELSSGIGTLTDGANKLLENANLILSSEQKLLYGISQLRSGIREMKSSVDSSVLQLKSSNAALHGFAEYAAHPIKLEASKIGEAKNTGMAMAPFMVSLCLWLGGLMTVIIFTTMDRYRFREIKPGKCMVDLGLFRFQLIAAIQSVCLAFTVVSILGLPVDNVAQFYGICILGGITFITIIQVLVLSLKDFGKLLSIIFMLLQLTAAGGMMSMELVPPFFKTMHPFMPMTYTINALRDNILAMDTADYSHSMAVLAITLAAGLLAALLISFIAHLIRQGRKPVPTQAEPAV